MCITKIVLAGKRIHLREVRLFDVNDDYYRWMNDPEVTRLTVSGYRSYSKEVLEEYVKEKLNDKNTIFLAIVLKEDSRHIGNIKLGPINWQYRRGDIGLLIGEKDCWGKGYATEVIGLVCKYAFDTLNLHKLTAGYFEGNEASCKAFKKNGFEIESTSSKHSYYDDKNVNVTWMALFNPGINSGK